MMKQWKNLLQQFYKTKIADAVGFPALLHV